MIDTVAVGQLCPEIEVSRSRPRLHHLRLDSRSREVDLVVDAAHLAWLRDKLGEQFVARMVLHIGPRGYRLGERIHALQIATL